MDAKYELLPEQEITTRRGETVVVQRLRALRDIPEAFIVAGELGGFVSSPDVLSHEGSCWIDGFSVVIDSIVKDNALIRHTAFVRNSLVENDATVIESANVDQYCHVKDNATISGNASVQGLGDTITTIKDKALVSGNTKIIASTIGGKAKAWGNSTVSESTMEDESIVEGKSSVHETKLREKAYATEDTIISNSTLEGRTNIYGMATVRNSTLSGRTEVADSATILDSTVTGNSHIYGSARVESTTVDSLVDEGVDPYQNMSLMNATGEGFIFDPTAVKEVVVPEVKGTTKPDTEESLRLKESLHRIEADYSAYVDSISRLIHYPVMADMGEKAIRTFAKNLRKAQATAEARNWDELEKTVDDAEDSFLIAESYARKTGISLLNDDEQGRLRKAGELMDTAINPFTTEEKRRTAFTECIRTLEGVIVLSDDAIKNLEDEIGLEKLQR